MPTTKDYTDDGQTPQEDEDHEMEDQCERSIEDLINESVENSWVNVQGGSGGQAIHTPFFNQKA